MWRFRAYSIELTLTAILLASIGFFGYLGYGLIASSGRTPPFSGSEAWDNAKTLMEKGARITGDPIMDETKNWLSQRLRENGWHVVIQPFTTQNQNEAFNLIARNRKEIDDQPVIILGTHYNSRSQADRDQDSEKRRLPVPGANGGASGTAILLEIADNLKPQEFEYRLCLAFFDAGDNEGLDGWNPAEGSTFFVNTYDTIAELQSCSNPQAVIILDLVGSGSQLMFAESSNPVLARTIQEQALSLGYADWLGEQSGGIQSGDHLPFVRAQVPTVYILNSQYPHRYTTQDTLDKLKADELEKIGRTLQTWLEGYSTLQ